MGVSSEIEQPPTKWQVYEQILRIPYYVLFDCYTYELKAFKLSGSRYDAIALSDSRFKIPELGLGLGVWQGSYQEIDQPWLRWCDARGNWIPTPTERAAYQIEQEAQRAEQERQRAEQERQKTERLIAQLRSLGVEPDLD